MGLLRITTTPLILSTSDLRDHLRIDGVQDDAALDQIQRAAVATIERQTNTQVGVGTFSMTLDTFPQGREIKLSRPPLKSVEAVKYLDSAGQEQTLAASAYRVDTSEQPGRIILKSDQSWPQTSKDGAAVVIDYTAGNDAGQEPETIRHLIRLLVGGWWECREGAVDRRYDELPVSFAVSTLLDMHRFIEVV